jgi:hypothetical protein
MEHISYFARMEKTVAKSNLLPLLGNCRQIEMYPAAAFVLEDMADQIVDMQTLHHQDDHARLLVVESGRESRLVPADDGLPGYFRHGVFGLKWIIDDDVGAADAGKSSPNRSGVAESILLRPEFCLSPPRHAERREKAPILAAIDHGTEQPVQIFGQFARIARRDNLARRVIPEAECGIGDRHAV